MQNFVYENRTKIIFGKGTEAETGKEIARYAQRVLLHHSGGHSIKSGLLDRVKENLKKSGIEWIELSGVKPNPRLSLVYEGIELCRKEKIKAILAVGGGSVIDSAKAIAVGVPYGGDVWELFERKANPADALPVGVVLTIPASGSESSFNSVITNEDGFWKRSIASEYARPVFAIMNPELTYTLPPYQTACGIADIISHVMERYFAQEDHVELTDQLCEGVLRAVIRNAPVVLENPVDYNGRAEIMWAGSLAHNNLLNTGRVGDWASHALEHELSAIYDIAHGAGLAIIFPAWIQYCFKDKLPLFARYAEKVWGVDGAYYNPEQAAREGIFRLKNFFRSLGLPVSFKDAALPTDRIPEMVKKVVSKGPVGQFKKLHEADVDAIYRLALE
jgi:alcohol dehydrogenase YqhD (iron-dependent ADH family)